jgi:hypothetical protein
VWSKAFRLGGQKRAAEGGVPYAEK